MARGGGKNLKAVQVAPDQEQAQDTQNEQASFLPDQMPEAGAPDATQAIDHGQSMSAQEAPAPVQAGADVSLPDQKSPLEGVYGTVSKLDPDRTAKIMALSKKLGEPEAYLDKNLDQVQSAMSAPDGSFFKQLEAQYPGTTKWLSFPKNMAVAHDDMANVAEHEGLIDRVKSAWGFEKSALQSGALQEELAYTRFQQMNGQAAGDGDFFRTGSKVASELGITETDPAKRAELISKKLEELEQNRPQSGMLKRGIYGATEFAPQILGGLAYGAKYGAPLAGAAAATTWMLGPAAAFTTGGAFGAGMTGGELEYNYKLMTGMTYDQMLKIRDVNGNPLPENVAKIASIATGGATAALSLVKLNAVMESIPGGKQFLARFASQAGEQVLSKPETMQTALKAFAQNYVKTVAHGVGAMEAITATNIAGTEAAKLASGQEFAPTSASDMMGQLLHTGEDALATFGVMAIPGASMGLGLSLRRVEKTEQAKEFYTALGASSDASKLRARLPEAHRDLISDLTKGTPVENIFIPVEAAEAYFQSKSIDPEAAMAELGVSKAYEEAKATGGDVRVPLSTWTDKIVGTEHFQGLRDDIKFDPEDMTPRQVSDRKAEIQEQVKKIMDERKAEEDAAAARGESQAKAEHVSKVFQMVQEQLKAAGVSKPEAQFNPQLHEAFFTTMGKHLGIAPEDLLAKFPLKIGRAEEGGSVSSPERAPAPEGHAPEAPEKVAAQPAYRQDVVETIRSEIAAGEHEKGNLRKDQDGNVTGRYGSMSSFPEYFQKKGYAKKEALRALEKHLAGQKLTEKQAKIVDDLYRSSGYDKDLTHAQAGSEPFLQGPAPKAGIEHLKDKWAALSDEEKLGAFARDPVTGTLNARAFEALGGDPEKPMVAHISVEGVKHVNDREGYGHEAADDLYRHVGQALMKEAPDVAKVGGDFAVHVKDQAELDQILSNAQKNLPEVLDLNGKPVSSEGFRLTGRVGENLDSASKAHIEHKQTLEASGERAARGAEPRGFQERPGAERDRAAKTAAKIPAKVKEGFKSLGDEEAFKRIHSTPTGLLTYDAFKHLPEAQHQASIDLNRLKEINDRFGYHEGNKALMAFETAANITAKEQGFRPDIAHKSGDEYLSQHDDGEKLHKFWVEVADKLDRLKYEGLNKDGEPETVPLSVSVGIDRTKDGAEQRLQEAKEASRSLPERPSRVRGRVDSGAVREGDAGGSGAGQSFDQSGLRGSASAGPDGSEAGQSSELNQGAPKSESGPRGRIRIGGEGYAIDLFRSADKSTFLHETGHYFLDIMGHISGDETAPAQVKEDYQTILKWLGVEKREDIGTEQHEKFARGFEAYLMEGKAPNSSLQRAFDRFRKWLTSVYKHVRNLNVDLSDDVRGVMDRMLSSEEAIEHAQHAMGFTGEQIEGVPVELQAKIHDLQMKARDQAELHLLKEQMVETTDRRKEFLKSERERLRGVAEEQVSQIPLYSAMDEASLDIGRTKRSGEGDDTVVHGQKAGVIAEKFLSGKLEPEAAAKFEALAEFHGFTDGEELAHQMIMAETGKTREKEIAGRVEVGMSAHEPLMNTDAIKAEAMRVIHGERYTELLALEREALDRLVHSAEIGTEVSKRKRLEARIEAQAAKEQAREILSQKPIKEATKAQPYITAERNAAVKVAKALAKKDFEAASEAKRQQMLNHAIAAEAMRNKVEADKALEYLSDFATRKNDLKDMPYGFTRQVDMLLANSGLAEKRNEDLASLVAIAKDMAAKGEEPSEIANRTGLKQGENAQWAPESLSDFVARVNENYYALQLPDSVMAGGVRETADLTLGELRDLRNSVKAIAGTGKKFERFLGEFKTADMRQAAQEFRRSVEENYGTPYADDLAPGSRHKDKLGELLAPIAKVPDVFNRFLDTILTTCHKLDGLKDGPAKEYIYRPFQEAEAREISRTAETMREMDALFAKHYDLDEFGKYKETRINVDGRYFTKDQILSMALNWGNEANRQRLMDGFGFDEAKMDRIFKHLDKKDWEFAQDTWNHLEKYWPEIKALEMEVNGIEPGKVEPAAFTNEHGSFQGGYYPIAYDYERSSDAFKHAQSKDALFKQFSTAAAHTDQGHAKARAAQVSRPLLLDLSVLKSHHEDVIHDLEFRRAVIDVARFMNQKDVKAGLMNALGVRGYAGISDWLKAAAGGGGEAMNAFDKAARWFRFKTVFFNLGYRIVSAPKIAIENLVNVSSELGVSGAFRAVKDYYSDASNLHQMVTDKSKFMEQRGKHLDRDLSELTNKWQGTEPSEPVKHFRAYAFYVHAFLDQAVSFPLWSHVYNEGIAGHGDEKLAVNQADEAVKRTFMSGGKIDQAEVMRGGERMKALTTAYGYQSMMWNRFSMQKFAAGQEFAEGNYLNAAAIAARATVYTFMLPAVTAALTREFLRNNQSDNPDDRKKRMAATVLEESLPLKFIPVLRDVSAFAIKRALGESHSGSLQLTPLEGALETILGVGGESLHALTGAPVSKRYPEQVVNSISIAAGVPKEFNDVVMNFLDWQQNNGELTWRDFVSRRTKK
jgi:GGDEF domain-containing protein